MATDSLAGDAAETRVRDAIRAAGVGEDSLYVNVVDLGVVAGIAVERERATVTVSLPTPASEVRAEIERGVREAAVGVDGVSTVEVGWEPSVTPSANALDFAPGVEHVIAVSSGKGGVGKSTVAANLAASLADAGAAVGLLDADVYGPNAPAMLGNRGATPTTTHADEIVPPEAHGVTVMSMDFIAGEDDPVIWRGPMVDDVLKQLFGDVAWGDLDYLVVDLPPGTGDAQLTLVQHLPVTGAVIVTTPQPVAIDDADRGLQQFVRYDVPILGVVENMSGFRCPDCGEVHDIFDSGGAQALAEEYDVPVLGQVPLDPAVGTLDGEDDDPPGVSVPLLGRLQLPQTRAERGGGDAAAPVSLRAPGSEAGGQFRLAGTRVAARIEQLLRTAGD